MNFNELNSKVNEKINNARKNTVKYYVNPMAKFLIAVNNFKNFFVMLEEHNKELRLKAASKGIAYSTLLTDIPLYSIIEEENPDYKTFLSEEESMIFTHVNEQVQKVYKNDYVAKQFDLMKTNDISLFIPFLIVLSEKLSRIIIGKENDRFGYRVLRDDLFKNISRLKNDDLQINYLSLIELTELYTQSFNDIISEQLFADEDVYKKTVQDNYNRHIILHAKSNFDVFNDQRSFNLIAIILFLVEIINVNNRINEINAAN
ncbi:hypothetical protein ETI10_03775 [Macrococcoides goetzii]|nr:hypothetical protein [Macrococcus goetzii]TDM42225.1 hypothetical protein ETI10_03775 [Macrococcus goetzii]